MENLNFRDLLNEEESIHKKTTPLSNNNSVEYSKHYHTNINLYETYSQGIMAAIKDKSTIRWRIFFISIPFGLLPWIFGLLGWNKVPDKYVELNCSYDFIRGYKSKMKSLKFLPSFLCWLTFTNIFYFTLCWFFVA